VAPTPNAPAYATRRAEVIELVEGGSAFDEIEDRINDVQLPEDQSAALWLLAWSLHDAAATRGPGIGVVHRTRGELAPELTSFRDG
jgi:hypothetical protein